MLDFTFARSCTPGEALSRSCPRAENLRLYVRGGEHVCVIGRNGVGNYLSCGRWPGSRWGRQDIRGGLCPGLRRHRGTKARRRWNFGQKLEK